jgi:general secretion pathway protein B
MSYILDALRRADAERERGRGAVPGLHSANLAPAAGDAPLTPPPATGRGLVVAAVVVGVAVLLAAVWWLGRASAPAAVPAPAAPLAVAPPPAVSPGQMPAPAPVAPTVVVAPPPAPAAVRVEPEPAPARAAAPPVAPAPPPVQTLAQLSPAQQQAFPPLALGGSVWSDSPANRFVIANGQVVREGEAAAADVTVERIEPRAVIVRWRDLRVELPL